MRLTQRPFRQPRGWKPPTRKAFDPALGEVGSWVTFEQPRPYYTVEGVPIGTYDVTVTGQVWATISGGIRARVWVADGTTYHDVAVSTLSAAATATQEPLLAA